MENSHGYTISRQPTYAPKERGCFPVQVGECSCRTGSCADCRRHILEEEKWVTNWVSRHLIATCYVLAIDLVETCNPRKRAKTQL